MEQYTNNAVTTLNGGINNSVTSITVTDASAFPTAGDFRIIIDSEIILVTSVAGSVFTVTRGVETSVAASHSNGVTVALIITAQSLLNLTRDGHRVDTYANRPAFGREGRIFVASDNPVIGYYDTGSAWKMMPMGPLFTAPTLGLFSTWVNQQNATYAQEDGFIRFEDDGTANSGEDWRLIVKTMSPGATATIITACRIHTASLNPQVFAHIYRNSSNDDFTTLGVIARAGQYGLSTFAYTWSDPNTAIAGLGEAGTPIQPDMVYLKSKFTVSTGGYELWFSYDMVTWKKVRNGTGATSGVTQCGLGINNFNPGSIDAVLTVDIFHLECNET